MSTAPLLSARDLHVRLGRRPVLAGVDLDVDPGEVVGIVGPNGAGKTTLVRALAGLVRCHRGAVTTNGVLGYCPQEPLLYDLLTPLEHFRYVASARGLDSGTWRARTDRLVARYSFASWISRPVAELSGGTRQKLNLALALLGEPDVLLLDEPYGGLEWEAYLRFWEHVALLSGAGRAVVVVSHLLYDRASLSRVLELADGRLRAAA